MVYARAELEKAASSIGVRLLAEGELPESEIIQRVYLISGLECLLNAHQHAGATEMRVVILRNKQRRTVVLRYTNNGSRPAGRIKPEGGLQLIRAAVEDAHVVMSFSDQADFSLEIELPMP